MAAKQTLFKKYLRVNMVILLTGFVVLGAMFSLFVSRYWEEEKHDLLAENAEGIASLVARNSTSVSNSTYLIDSKLTQGFLTTFSSNINADIFITDKEGTVLLYSNESVNVRDLPQIPTSVVNAALENGYSGTSNLGGFYDHDCYVVAVPITKMSDRGMISIGTVFTATNAKYLSDFHSDVLRMMVWAAIAAFLLSFLIMWFLSYRMVKPLRQMSYAAKCFAQGDFSQRVVVESQDEIGQLSAAFNNMADSLAASENTRRAFIANVSHELKTPMTTIAGFIDGILDGTIPNDKQQHYLEIVSKEVKRLSRLVRTMLDLSRIDNGELKMHKQRFDLTHTVFSALLSFEQQIEKKHIEVQGLENAESLFIDGDPDMIYQVVYNLIENAVKFVNEKGYIKISITDSRDKTLVSITNSGEGISSDEIRYVFDKFYKTDKSRSQDKNGMGLGLYIVKTIMKLHGGDICARSEAGSYCEFEFWLPKISSM